MSNDDSRGNESPDRQDASPSNIRPLPDGGEPATQTLRKRLEAIDHLTQKLLEDVNAVSPILEDVDEDTRREARRRLREIRAETSQIGLLLIGPEAAIPYRPDDAPPETTLIAGDGDDIVTTYAGPAAVHDPEAHDHERNACDESESEDESERDAGGADERDADAPSEQSNHDESPDDKSDRDDADDNDTDHDQSEGDRDE
ncbi:hypothetical protein GS429_02535 [Natronorubrum sp. JWXQ-INN-674]|uniref:Uncharacterized protein n=1 Tax=Natronorubrum halalkaliphilum TaxID=2691917 RepID=A0A6B0VK80_9EURY|nr:hypothetical protein [Natronorubrum halalkaliphilum]MXV60959.1 hypothetical protein [Natronorubrum halalkaliphilum]